jgi:hypothetical protein
MIPSYSSYIRHFIFNRKSKKRPVPGEHHFVAAYLVPKLYSLHKTVPDYVNPDGTKGIFGDVVYFRDNKHHFGIEVKLDVIRLTKGEFNKWIVSPTGKRRPNIFLGVGRNGIALTTWQAFRRAYIAANRKRTPKWKAIRIEKGYGPMKNVDLLQRHLTDGEWFPFESDVRKEGKRESAFLTALLTLMSSALPL